MEEVTKSPVERAFDEGTLRVDRNGETYTTTSWASVDLEPYKRGEIVVEPPAFLFRDDNGSALIYPNRPHVFFGESESLKSWAALLACRSVLENGLTALYIDFESSEPSFVERARHVGIPDNAIGNSLRYVRPIEPLEGDARKDFSKELEPDNGLVILDGVTEAYALNGWNINSAEDAARFQALFKTSAVPLGSTATLVPETRVNSAARFGAAIGARSAVAAGPVLVVSAEAGEPFTQVQNVGPGLQAVRLAPVVSQASG